MPWAWILPPFLLFLLFLFLLLLLLDLLLGAVLQEQRLHLAMAFELGYMHVTMHHCVTELSCDDDDAF